MNVSKPEYILVYGKVYEVYTIGNYKGIMIKGILKQNTRNGLPWIESKHWNWKTSEKDCHKKK